MNIIPNKHAISNTWFFTKFVLLLSKNTVNLQFSAKFYKTLKLQMTEIFYQQN